jgi:hypothetical protein
MGATAAAATVLAIVAQTSSSCKFVVLLLCAPFVPVTELMLRGRVRMSMMWGVCTQGMRKCVPSPTTSGKIPLNLSKITARSPPSTAAAQQQITPDSRTQQRSDAGSIDTPATQDMLRSARLQSHGKSYAVNRSCSPVLGASEGSCACNLRLRDVLRLLLSCMQHRAWLQLLSTTRLHC